MAGGDCATQISPPREDGGTVGGAAGDPPSQLDLEGCLELNCDRK